MKWADDIDHDRPLGLAWEPVLSRMLSALGIRNRLLSSTEPFDIETQDGFCEVKHKQPAKAAGKRGCYGLEEYRVVKMIRDYPGRLWYVIHDYLSGGARSADDERPPADAWCDPAHWFAADLRALSRNGPDDIENGVTYFGGQERAGARIWYWHATRWGHLESMLGPLPAESRADFAGYRQPGCGWRREVMILATSRGSGPLCAPCALGTMLPAAATVPRPCAR